MALWTHASVVYLEKMIIRYKVPVSMSGINLFRERPGVDGRVSANIRSLIAKILLRLMACVILSFLRCLRTGYSGM